MTTVVRQDNLVPIPDEIVRALGLHEGSEVEWDRSEDGSIVLRSVPAARSHPLRGILKPYLKDGESGVATFLREREADARLDGSR